MDKIDLFSNSNNPSESTNAAIYTAHDGMLYSMKLHFENVTSRDFTIEAKKQIDFEPKLVMNVKQRGQHKVLLYNSASDDIHIYDEKLSKVESVIPVAVNDDLISIQSQLMNIVYHNKRKIGIVRLTNR